MRALAAWLVVSATLPFRNYAVTLAACLVLPPLLVPRGDRLALWPPGQFGFLALALLPVALILARPALMVAFPEELFYRGFLQRMWKGKSRPFVRFFGVPLGWEWPAAAGAFALSHLVHQGPMGLLTFFPGLLFGWTLAGTRSVWPAVLLHAASNWIVA